MSFNFKHTSGIVAKNDLLNFSIDPTTYKETSEINFVTHAHRDHINMTKRCYSKNYVTTLATKLAMEVYFGKFNSQLIDYNTTAEFEDYKFRFRNSGHIYGSYILDAYLDKKITITGDLGLEDTYITNRAIPQKTDVLVIESTYGNLNKSFPKKEEEYERLIKWIKLQLFNGRLPVIFAYALGKTQEILALINKEIPVRVGLGDMAYKLTRSQRKAGANLTSFERVKGNISEIDILILPPSHNKHDLLSAMEYSSKKQFVYANVTGQDFFSNEVFKISSHADFNSMLKFIDYSEPKLVLTYHGSQKDSFARLIERKLKIPARALRSEDIR